MIALFSAVLILLFVPWLDTSRVKSGRYRPLYRQFFWLFVITCVLLGWLGSKPPIGGYVTLARLLTAWYFIHFLIVLPLLGFIEKPKPLPASITEPAMRGGKAATILLAAGLGASALALAPDKVSAQVIAGRNAAAKHLVVFRAVRRLRHRPIAARLQNLQ